MKYKKDKHSVTVPRKMFSYIKAEMLETLKREKYKGEVSFSLYLMSERSKSRHDPRSPPLTVMVRVDVENKTWCVDGIFY